MSERRIPELLAPVGGRAQLEAAVQNGADAVYMGGNLFNARIKADNFTKDDIRDAVDYAHERGVKVYVTLNTLIKDSELAKAFSYTNFLYGIGVDAIIVQDMGLARLIHKYLPDMTMHLSTQGTVYNKWAIPTVKKLGFKRVVPARELSIEQIRELAGECHRSEGGSCEVEVFVHGALCMCYSGQCQMSRILGGVNGRSGNRGLCAQPCRLPYENDKGEIGYFLSPKDICYLDDLAELCEAGVDSLKIEGRLKSPQYVAIVTSIYRKYLDMYRFSGKVTIADEDRRDLQQIFNRGGFTSGYLHGNPGSELLSGNSPKNVGVKIGAVQAVHKGNIMGKKGQAGKDSNGAGKGSQAVMDMSSKDKGKAKGKLGRGAAGNGSTGTAGDESYLVDVKLDAGASVQMGDGIEIHGDVLQGNVISYMKMLPKGIVRMGDIKGEVKPGDEVYRVTSKELIKNAEATYIKDSRKGVVADIVLDARIGSQPQITMKVTRVGRDEIDSGSMICSVAGDAPVEEAVNKAADPVRIEEQLRKLGSTSIEAGNVVVNIDENAALPISIVNQMRRSAAEVILQKIRERRGSALGEHEIGEICHLEELGERTLGSMAVDGGELGELVPVEEFRGEGTPYILNVSKGALDEYLAEHFEEVATHAREHGVVVGNLGWIDRFKDAGVKVYGGAGLNVYNAQAKVAMEELGVQVVQYSYELEDTDLESVPLMITEHPVDSEYLIDRKGAKYRIVRSPLGDKTMIYPVKPL